MNSVSQPCISSKLARVPSSPRWPVTLGWSSLTTALPSSAFTTPAPSRSATSNTASPSPRAPAPTSNATFLPVFRISAAASSCSSDGNGALR